VLESIIQEFCEVAHITLEDWNYWKTEHGCSDKLIVADPSIIMGLVDLKKIKERLEWKFYAKKSEPTKKMDGNFVFEGKMYGVRWLRDIFNMLQEIVEVCSYKEAVMFRVTEDIGIIIASKITAEGFYYNEEGVMFIEEDFEETKQEWRTVTKEKEFIKWENNMAKRKHSGKANIWYEEVYRWELFFENEEEDMGDFMLL